MSILSLVAFSRNDGDLQQLAVTCSVLLRINAEEAAALKDMLAYAAPSSPRTVVQTLKLGHAQGCVWTLMWMWLWLLKMRAAEILFKG